MKTKAIIASSVVVLAATAAYALQQGRSLHPLVGQPAPEFSASGTDGKTYSLANAEKKGPMILAFWKNPCPHNPKASPMVNSIVEAYKGKVNFVGVVNADGETAKNFQKQFKMDYEFLNDGGKTIIKNYKQPFSISFVVVGKNKKVEAVIGGYSQDAMAELNSAMAKAAGVPEAKLDFSAAPKNTTYG